MRVKGLASGVKLTDVSFDLHKGEVLGVVALEGQGQDELFDVLAGARKATGGTIEVTFGTDEEPCIALWYYEPRPPVVSRGVKYEEPPLIGGATLGTMGNGRKGLPLMLERDQFHDDDSFITKEMKYARRWLYSKGVTLPQEDRNPVDVQMESFFDCCRTGDSPKAGVEVGLANSTAVILSNLAMDEERRVRFDEIEKLGRR